MNGPVVIGFDSRPASRDALEFAAGLCEQTGVGLIAAHVPQGQYPFTPYDLPYQRELREYMSDVRREIAPELGRVPLGRRREVCAYHAATAAIGLQDLAASEGARMIVVGSSRRTPAGRVLVGSTASRLRASASCPVAVAPRGYAEHRHRLISVGVALDGCRRSEAALDHARGLAAELDAKLIALSVATRHGVAVPPNGIEQVVLEGPTVRALTRASKELDLLVVGCRETGGLAGPPAVSSVSGRLMETSACPLVAVPEGLGLERRATGRHPTTAPA